VTELVLGAPFGMNAPEHPMANMMALGPPERLATLTKNPDIFNGRFPSGPDPAFEAARVRAGQAIMPGPLDAELLSVLSQINAPTQRRRSCAEAVAGAGGVAGQCRQVAEQAGAELGQIVAELVQAVVVGAVGGLAHGRPTACWCAWVQNA